MSITGLPGQGPVRVGIPIDDLCAGLLLAQAILMALIEREQSGEGQWVHTSLLEAQIFMLDFQASRWLIAGEVAEAGRQRPPDRHPDRRCSRPRTGRSTSPPRATIMFRRFCEAADAQHLLNDPGLRDRPAALEKPQGAEREDRRDHQEAPERLLGRADERGRRAVRADLHDRPDLRRPAGASISKWRGRCDHPKLGDIKVVGQAINMTRTPEPAELRPTPDLGQHTEEVLRELGYNDAAIADLRAREVV